MTIGYDYDNWQRIQLGGTLKKKKTVRNLYIVYIFIIISYVTILYEILMIYSGLFNEIIMQSLSKFCVIDYRVPA